MLEDRLRSGYYSIAEPSTCVDSIAAAKCRLEKLFAEQQLKSDVESWLAVNYGHNEDLLREVLTTIVELPSSEKLQYFWVVQDVIKKVKQ